MTYKFAVRMTTFGSKVSKSDKIYAICNTYQEAFEVCDALQATGQAAWVDTLAA